jgi:hypothetical protein
VTELKVSVAVPTPPERLVGSIPGVSRVVPEAERNTVPEKWFKGVIVIMDEPVLPALICTLAKLAVIV